MSIFSIFEPKTTPEPVVPPIEVVLRLRQAELKEQILQLDSELDVVALEAKAFRSAHTVTGKRGELQFIGSTSEQAPELQERWLSIVRRAERIVITKNGLLAEHAELKALNGR